MHSAPWFPRLAAAMRWRTRTPTSPVAAALLATAFATTLTAASPGQVRDLPQTERGVLSETEVLAAQRAWSKLRDGLKQDQVHGTRRREMLGSPLEGEATVAVKNGGEGDEAPWAARPRALLTEFTVDAESSFTAVSRALDALANHTRRGAADGGEGSGIPGSGERPAIAKNVYIVEGSVDADSVKDYLNSKRASDALARAEANALRKVMTMLLQPDSKTSIARTRIGRSIADALSGYTASRQPSERIIGQSSMGNMITNHHHRGMHGHKKARMNNGNKNSAIIKSMSKKEWEGKRNIRATKIRNKEKRSSDEDEDEDETERDKPSLRPESKRRKISNDNDDDDEDSEVSPSFLTDSPRGNDKSERTETRRLRQNRGGNYRIKQVKDSLGTKEKSSSEVSRRYDEQYAREEAAKKARYREEESEEEEDPPTKTGQKTVATANARNRAAAKEDSNESSFKQYEDSDMRRKMKNKRNKSIEEDDDDDDEEE